MLKRNLKTVKRITIDPSLSHVQSHLNGAALKKEKTHKSTANAWFSPVSLKTLSRYNLIPDKLMLGGQGTIKARVQTLSRCFCSPFCCCHSVPPPNFFFVGHRTPGQSLLCIASGAPVTNTKTTTPHTMLQDDISSTLTPPTPPPNPISEA